MAEATPVIDFDDARGVPIADVCHALGVPMPTLRSWELRYAMPAIRHVHGKHRRYLPSEVHAIRLMRDEIARGQPAALAAATVRKMLGIGGPAEVFIHRLLEESERLDTRSMRTTLDQAAAALGLSDCIDDVLLPTMRQVGIWWEIGHCDIAQERSSTETVRSWLDRRIAFAPTPTMPRPVLLACGPKDWHTIGLECLATLLRDRGWSCRILGARLATPTIVTAATAAEPSPWWSCRTWPAGGEWRWNPSRPSTGPGCRCSTRGTPSSPPRAAAGYRAVTWPTGSRMPATRSSPR